MQEVKDEDNLTLPKKMKVVKKKQPISKLYSIGFFGAVCLGQFEIALIFLVLGIVES